jgi:hypothetical protein
MAKVTELAALSSRSESVHTAPEHKTMPEDRMTRLAEAGNEIQALVARLQERVIQAARDGYNIEEADLFVATMMDISGEPATNEPAPQHPYQKLRRLLEEAVREIDVKYPRQAGDAGSQ